MPNKILIQAQDGTPAQISFADHATDFSPTAANNLEVGTPTDVQMDLTSLADGAARQSAKVDLGEHRADEYHVRCAFEIALTPNAGDLFELYWAPSGSATAGTANPAGVSGADAAYDGYSSNLSDAVKQLVKIGVFVCTAQVTPTVQVGEVQGRLVPPERYGSLIVKNESGAALHSDAVESHIVFDPIVVEVQ